MNKWTPTAVILAAALLCGRAIASDEERERRRDKHRGDREEHVERDREHHERHEEHRDHDHEHAERHEEHRDREHPEAREREMREHHERERHAHEMRERREREMHAQRKREMHEHREMAERREHEMRERELPEERILHFLEEHMPHMMPELRKLREHNPDAYHRELRQIAGRIGEHDEIKRHAPDVAEALLRSHQIEHECHKLAQRIRETEDPEEREARAGKLREMLNQVFELRLAEPMLKIRHMEQEIREIKQMIERRKQNQERIVTKHMKEMIGPREEGELEWW